MIKAISLKKQMFWGLSALLASGVAAYWYIRVSTFPCGRFDSTSGCVSSVKLQTDELGFADGEKIEVSYNSFDLASGAGVVAVGLHSTDSTSGIESRTPKRAIVALFNAQDGRLIRVMRRLQGEYSRSEEVALSPDGTLLASYALGDNENSLIVQRTGDGSLVKIIYETSDRTVINCLAMLDFSTDNSTLQCGSTLYRLDRNEERSIFKNHQFIVPSVTLAEFSPGGRAPDGTTVEGDYFQEKKILDRLSPQEREAKLQSLGDNRGYVLTKPGSEPILFGSPLELFDSSFDRVFFSPDIIFSPDSRLFIGTYTAYREARGMRRFVPPPFRQLTAIAIWTRDAELKNSFFTNRRDREIAWSRDSQHFATIDDDFSVKVFKAP